MMKTCIALIVVLAFLSLIVAPDQAFGGDAPQVAAIVGGTMVGLAGVVYLIVKERSRKEKGSAQTSENAHQVFNNFLPGFLPKAHDEPLPLSGEIIIFRW